MTVDPTAVAVEGVGYPPITIATRGWIVDAGGAFVETPQFVFGIQLTTLVAQHYVDSPQFVADAALTMLDAQGYADAPQFVVDAGLTLREIELGGAQIVFQMASELITFTPAQPLMGELQCASPQVLATLAQAEMSAIVSAEGQILTSDGITKVTFTGPANVVLELLSIGGQVIANNGSHVVGFQNVSPIVSWEVD